MEVPLIGQLRAVLYIAIVISALCISSSISVAAAASSNSIDFFTPDSKPYGLTFQEHVKNFWKWVISLPKDKSPWNDPTGANCAIGQSGTNSSVFYLGSNGGGTSYRTCKVPAGKGLFIPVSPMEVSDKESPNSSIDQLTQIAKQDQDSVNSLNLKIGDKVYNYQELLKYRIHTFSLDVVFPDSNAIFGVMHGGPSKAAADGFYIITKPLPKGTYTIQYESAICKGVGCLQTNFAQNIVYTVIAQ
jgi:hypothetical protein